MRPKQAQSRSRKKAVPSRSAHRKQDLPSFQRTKRHPSVDFSAISRSPNMSGSPRSDASLYSKESPETLTRREAPSLDTSIHDPSIFLTVPKRLKKKFRGDSGGPSAKAMNRRADAAFHLLISEIASSNEEVIVTLLAEQFGVQSALRIARAFNWKLGARFYHAITQRSAFRPASRRDRLAHLPSQGSL